MDCSGLGGGRCVLVDAPVLQECLGVALALETFRGSLEHNLWTAFEDNMGVLHALTQGSGGGAEVNQLAGALWLDLAHSQIALNLRRVESHANIADGPTRDRFDMIEHCAAQWVEPRLPPCARDIWAWGTF